MFRWLRLSTAFLTLLAVGSLHSQIVLVNGSTYTGQTLADSIQINASNYAYFTGGTSFTGPNATFGNSAGLYWQQVGALTGKTFSFGTNAYVYVQGVGNSLTLNSATLTSGNGTYFYLSGANTSLTLDSGTTMTGGISLYSDGSAGTAISNQGTLTHNVGSGSIYAASFTNAGSITATSGSYLYLGYPSAGYNTTNTGTVTADGSGTYVYLRGNFDNNGTLTAQNSGNLLWDGANTTANLGNVTLTGGGRALLNGTIDNTAATLTAPTGGSFELYGGTISGGTIASGALTFTSSGGYLSGATLNGDLSLGANAYVRLTNNANYTGTNVTLGNSAGLYWQQAGTLTGNSFSLGNNAYVYVQGTGNNLTLNSSTVTSGNGSYFYLSGVNTSLTVGSGTTMTGGISLYSDGSSGTAISNQGTLTHNIGSGSIYAANFTNAGSITATGGSYLYLGYPSAGYNTTNTGTVTADGSGTYVYLRGNFDNNGTLTAQNSSNLLWDGSNTTANLGNVTLTGGGRALLNGTLDNTAATLTAPTGGSFELYGGTISGGTIASGALSFTTSGGYLSGATLTGDLNLATASSYVRFNSGATFTGANATLANNSHLRWQQVGTLSGKTITLGSGAYIYVEGANNALTLSNTTSVTGDVSIYTDGNVGTAITNQGTLTHTGGSGQIYATNFTNEGAVTATGGTLYLNYPSVTYNATNTATGTVTADGASTTVYLRGNFDNNGTVTAQNSGTLLFDGSNTTANLGTVVLATGGRARLNGTIDNSATTLNAPTGGTFELYGGTISGGTIASGALSFTTSGGYLSGATLTGDLNLATASSYVRLNSGATFTGANATLANNSHLRWQQVGTLSGKTITLGSGAYIYVEGANNALTLSNTTSVTGDVSIYTDGNVGTAITNQGTLTHTGGSGQIYATNFTNEGAVTATGGTLYLNYPSVTYNATNTATGTVTADGASTTVYLRGNFDNNGTVTAQNSGTLLFDGSNTTANLGTVVLATGGRARLNGTLDNSATTLNAPTGGTFELYGGTISGGTIASGALSFTTSGGYLSGATLTGDLNLATASSYVRLNSGATFTGANATLANNSHLRWQQVGSLSGKTITLGSGAYIYVEGANNALTLSNTTSVTGDVSIYTDGNAGTAITNQGTLTHTGGSGQIYATNFTNEGAVTATGGTLYLNYPSVTYNATNTATGTVTADGASTTVYLRGNFDNNGTLTAQNSGTLFFDGNTTTANLGSVTLGTGGRARLNGTLDNSATTLNAPTGGAFELYGGTINGGTIASGALSFTSSGGYLSGTTLMGDLALSAGSSYVRLQNNASFTGALLSMAANAGLYWQQVGTLSGKTITQGTGSYLYVQGTNNTLTLDATTSVTGALSLYTDGSAGTAITNQGSLTHNTNTTGYLYAETLTNQGSLAVNTGTLYFGYYSDDTSTNAAGGTITLGGGNMYVYSPMTNLGLMNIVSGTLFTNANLTNTSGTIGGTGIINGGLAVTGGTLAPGNSIGTLTFANGNFSVTGASIFSIELDATTADKIVFQNPGTVNIGAGLLQLSLNLLSAPTANMTYTLMDITSGGSGISGYLAGLPNNGDGFTAYFGGNPYDFHVSYLTNKLTIQAVPEPGTYALMGAGLAAVALLRRRRKVS